MYLTLLDGSMKRRPILTIMANDNVYLISLEVNFIRKIDMRNYE